MLNFGKFVLDPLNFTGDLSLILVELADVGLGVFYFEVVIDNFFDNIHVFIVSCLNAREVRLLVPIVVVVHVIVVFLVLQVLVLIFLGLLVFL